MATIIRIGGGGGKAGIDLTVVGGTTQPENPKNNTIWVKTETAIGTAYLSPTAPESHAVGDVWINTTNRYQSDASAVASSTHLLTVAEDPYLTVNVLQFKQWDGSAWNWCDGGIYANNAWTDMALYIYWYGTQNEAYPIQGRRAGSSSGTPYTTDIITYNDDSFSAILSSSQYYGIIITSAGCSIDVSKFTTVGLKIRHSHTATIAGGVTVGFSSHLTASNPSLDIALNKQGTALDGTSVVKELSVPITATGIVRPSIGLRGSSKTVTYTIYYWVLT